MFEIYFLTSSRIKFDHIKYLVQDYDISIKPQIDYGKAYQEPRILDRETLLFHSLNDANARLARSIIKTEQKNQDVFGNEELSNDLLRLINQYQDKFFIIEDTSVRIDALSETTEFPGLDVKYWMKETSFEQLNSELIKRGNNRRVTVRSDIVAYLPRTFRNQNSQEIYKIFTGVSSGFVTEKEYSFETNPFYPWLDNKTFNKWFVPEGESIPISMLSIDDANKYDFRSFAVQKLIEFIENTTSLQLTKRKTSSEPYQESLFSQPNVILCGPTCAGKTVLATHLAKKFGYYHIEASDFMHLAYRNKHGSQSEVDIHSFARTALKEDPEIVARQVNEHLKKISSLPIIITGFRSPEELPSFLQPSRQFKTFYINANPEIRYQRSLKRGRSDVTESYEAFLNRDVLQFEMGLEDIKELDKTIQITNESSLANYFREFEKEQISNQTVTSNYLSTSFPDKPTVTSLEEAILVTLLSLESKGVTERFTTTEIASLINQELGKRYYGGREIKTDKNNVSRYFNQKNYPYYDLIIENGVKKYKLSTTGISHAHFLLQKLYAA